MPQDSCRDPRLVVLVADEGSNPFELACACEVFGARRRPEIGRDLYRFRVVTPRRRVAVRDAMFTIGGAGGLGDIDDAHTVIVPNRPDTAASTHPAVIKAVRRAHQRGARLVGLCTGAYTLAEAGLLDGRPAAVHWQLADDFQRRHPKVDLRPDVLFVDDGDILTSAGSAAALDLALHIVRLDHGAQIANYVSRRLVFSAFRDGGQQQFIEQPVTLPGQATLSQTLEWAQARLGTALSVADLARHAHLSPTTLHRRFRAELGTTPLAWLTAERVDLARRLLEQEVAPLDLVAHRSGLGSAANLRAQMRRRTGLSPSQYRTQFAVRRTLSPPRVSG
jgi:AraC family transcriptional regulator, transcriptional activator FtrA